MNIKRNITESKMVINRVEKLSIKLIKIISMKHFLHMSTIHIFYYKFPKYSFFFRSMMRQTLNNRFTR